jgi:BA14K-like protein
MEFVMTGRSMLLASAMVAVSGIWAGSASAAPIHADMSLQDGAVFEQVQMRGHSGGGGNRGSGMSSGRSGGGGSGMSSGRSSSGMSIGRSSGGNWSGNRTIGGGNFATNSRQSFAATNNRPGNWSAGNSSGRRADWRQHRRGFRGPIVGFGFGPGYYDYGYDYGYYPYDDDAYAYVAPGAGVADGDSCGQRFRSYDPSTGTYLGYDGLRHPCP